MTLAQVREIPEAEFVGWLAYFRVKAQTAELDAKATAARAGR